MPAPEQAVTERLVSRIWSNPHLLPPGARSAAGETLELVYRGRWSHGVGPDFRDAMIVVGSGPLLRGEVEIHVRTSDWSAHGHHRDPRYDSVLLHVVMWDDSAQPAQKSNGERVPTLALSEHLRLSPYELSALEAEVLAEPLPAPDSEAPCSLRPVSLDRLASLLDGAGDERLRSKAARFGADLAAVDAEQVLYEGLAESMGYRGNQAAFRRLAVAVPLGFIYSLGHREAPSDRYPTTLSLLFGAAGLLPSQRPDAPDLDWESASYVEEMEGRWLLLAPQWGWQSQGYGEWRFGGVRPPNYPTRRIAALAQVLSLHLEGGLLNRVVCALGETSAEARLASLRRVFEGVEADGFWAQRCDFGRRYLHGTPQLLGSDRAADIVVNVLLPFALAWADWSGQPALGESALQTYREHPPLAENEITREMRGRLCPAKADESAERKARTRGKPALANSARRQQGLLHVYRMYCEERRCLDCPVVRMGT